MKEFRKTRECKTFDVVLNELKMTETDYYDAIRCSYKRISILYKRQSNAVGINSYIKTLLDTWEGNHDIQYVPDPYGFVHYLLKYCLKADEGMLHMMKEVEKECRQGNKTVFETVKKIANIFHGSSLITAQQSVEELLGYSVLKFSNVDKFINTHRPNKRVYIRKNKLQLAEMDDDDASRFDK